ncbi:MAG: 3-isopropylmalate dehydrogenase [Armatimonadetes bacterium CG_4_10_14_3_um_filter_66_18]|nr:3-isopropylmalate dehydrogenase [Armatimonadota bacterium]PIW19681.1 MAG: 3-isopropylmalate dehydrogenase [Armatimonadetes bacterium CG17_big_fil_post_rev_8_21_14_2_50_66_6]PIY44068.1 MAG: 3-isopropylmalate dehydrogenase [Armatimonadetes bacterium CG_4_10_14_3_um_filter_66_18]PIZ48465.1 MAG: 3-isopropylmalate dehydrogenase [Armatimonadetes bacterium CG_4_10_14_0_8_um_filter_66_14]PJB63926.1 MAG: 3-isopropylmalate dehydrogenase [Armatimonadetes bacterium CG_4_9_14_3_um_filter_66_14]
MYKIAVLPGDGTGPEVVREGLKVLEAVSAKTGLKFDFTHFDFGGDRYLATGEVLPDSAVEDMKQFDSIYLGAIGHPDVKPGVLEKGILLALRFALDQYINLRPVKLYPNVETPLRGKGPEHIDFVAVRENTEDLYCGMGGFAHKGTKDEVAVQSSMYTRMGVERALRYAFEYAKNNRSPRPWKGLKQEDVDKGITGQLTLVGKTNVLTYVYDLWERAFHEIGEADYPEIKRQYNHVDACCMWFVKSPEWYDVIVTGNMFGDIITDLGAMIQGGMGVAAGGNINPEGVSMFEPIGGSAPKYTGMNVINPLAAICAAQMMLSVLGEQRAADIVENAVVAALESGKIKSMSVGKIGLSTSEIGDLVAQNVADA